MMAAESIYIIELDRYFSQSIIKSNRSSSLCLRDGASCEKWEVEFCNIESFSLTEQTPGFPVYVTWMPCFIGLNLENLQKTEFALISPLILQNIPEHVNG